MRGSPASQPRRKGVGLRLGLFAARVVWAFSEVGLSAPQVGESFRASRPRQKQEREHPPQTQTPTPQKRERVIGVVEDVDGSQERLICSWERST